MADQEKRLNSLLTLLKREGKPFKMKDIVSRLDISPSTASKDVGIAREREWVKVMEIGPAKYVMLPGPQADMIEEMLGARLEQHAPGPEQVIQAVEEE